MAEQHPRAWQRMLSGRRLDLLNPSPLDVEVEDIAHGLSRVARWNGQTRGDWAFSVAQHCLLVEELCGVMKPDLPARWRLAALLHDAQEYVVGDLISPFKAAVGWSYKALEKRLSSAVFLRFGLPGELPKTVEAQIKRGDQAAAYVEAIQLAGFEEKEARRLFRPPRGHDLSPERLPLVPQDPESAKSAYLERFATLQSEMQGKG
ncbi:HD family hydrolase [Fodinicurvata fenggangensis]|uniref:HD family hydrolase n=1 Tax=Fodinicurvata fenggangensis TaxID=1121830 RepID=UPI000ABB2223|nr:HD family hydrolase [Fodinicurvata fenggangensis]